MKKVGSILIITIFLFLLAVPSVTADKEENIPSVFESIKYEIFL